MKAGDRRLSTLHSVLLFHLPPVPAGQSFPIVLQVNLALLYHRIVPVLKHAVKYRNACIRFENQSEAMNVSGWLERIYRGRRDFQTVVVL